MKDSELVLALQSMASLLGILWLLGWCYPKLCLEVFRQRMFALRDRFFDEAHRGVIEFDSPAYGLLRTTMNGFIRFGHRVSLLEALIFIRMNRGDIEAKQELTNFERKWRKALERVTSAAQRETVERYRKQMDELVTWQILTGSPVLVALLIILFPLMYCSNLIGSLRHAWSQRVQRSDLASAALAMGGG